MIPSSSRHFKAAEIGVRWDYHPSSVVRIMRRFGCSGIKFGDSKQASRRYASQDVEMVEKLAALKASGRFPGSSRRPSAFDAVPFSGRLEKRPRIRVLTTKHQCPL